MWIEVDNTELQRRLDEDASLPTFLFFYTPLCGTCKLANRMLTIVMEALPGVDILSCNVNQMPKRAFAWQIESVPCLAVVENGELTSKMYAFHSVDHVFQHIRNVCMP